MPETYSWTDPSIEASESRFYRFKDATPITYGDKSFAHLTPQKRTELWESGLRPPHESWKALHPDDMGLGEGIPVDTMRRSQFINHGYTEQVSNSGNHRPKSEWTEEQQQLEVEASAPRTEPLPWHRKDFNNGEKLQGAIEWIREKAETDNDYRVGMRSTDVMKGFVTRLPLGFGIPEFMEASNSSKVLDRIYEDKATSADYYSFASDIVLEEMKEKDPRMMKVLRGASQMPAFLADMYVTGGIGAGMKAFGRKGLALMAKKLGKDKFKSLMAKMSFKAAKTILPKVAEAGVYAGVIDVGSTAAEAIPQRDMRFDVDPETQKITGFKDTEKEHLANSLLRSVTNKMIEYGVERWTGTTIMGGFRGAKNLLRPASQGGASVSRGGKTVFEGTPWANSDSKWFNEVIKDTYYKLGSSGKQSAIGFNGILGEIGEERVTEILQAANEAVFGKLPGAREGGDKRAWERMGMTGMGIDLAGHATGISEMQPKELDSRIDELKTAAATEFVSFGGLHAATKGGLGAQAAAAAKGELYEDPAKPDKQGASFNYFKHPLMALKGNERMSKKVQALLANGSTSRKDFEAVKLPDGTSLLDHFPRQSQREGYLKDVDRLNRNKQESMEEAYDERARKWTQDREAEEAELDALAQQYGDTPSPLGGQEAPPTVPIEEPSKADEAMEDLGLESVDYEQEYVEATREESEAAVEAPPVIQQPSPVAEQHHPDVPEQEIAEREAEQIPDHVVDIEQDKKDVDTALGFSRVDVMSRFPGMNVQEKDGDYYVNLKNGPIRITGQESIYHSDRALESMYNDRLGIKDYRTDKSGKKQSFEEVHPTLESFIEAHRAGRGNIGSIEKPSEAELDKEATFDVLATIRIANSDWHRANTDQLETLQHEVIHYSHIGGLWSKPEWDTLVSKYSDPKKSVRQQSEDIARAGQSWVKPGIIQKITDWVNKTLHHVTKGKIQLKPEAVQNLLFSKGFLQDRTSGVFSEGTLAARDAPMAMAEGDYRGIHKAPGRDNDYNASMDNMNAMYPDDIYSDDGARLYGDGRGGQQDRQVHQIIKNVRDNPDAMVTVYRGFPSDVKGNINPGDWVTPVRQYAEDHALRYDDDANIVEKQVRAGDLFTEGNSLYEFGWDPEPKPPTDAPMAMAEGDVPTTEVVHEKLEIAASIVDSEGDIIVPFRGHDIVKHFEEDGHIEKTSTWEDLSSEISGNVGERVQSYVIEENKERGPENEVQLEEEWEQEKVFYAYEYDQRRPILYRREEGGWDAEGYGDFSYNEMATAHRLIEQAISRGDGKGVVSDAGSLLATYDQLQEFAEMQPSHGWEFESFDKFAEKVARILRKETTDPKRGDREPTTDTPFAMAESDIDPDAPKERTPRQKRGDAFGEKRGRAANPWNKLDNPEEWQEFEDELTELRDTHDKDKDTRTVQSIVKELAERRKGPQADDKFINEMIEKFDKDPMYAPSVWENEWLRQLNNELRLGDLSQIQRAIMDVGRMYAKGRSNLGLSFGFSLSRDANNEKSGPRRRWNVITTILDDDPVESYTDKFDKEGKEDKRKGRQLARDDFDLENAGMETGTQGIGGPWVSGTGEGTDAKPGTRKPRRLKDRVYAPKDSLVWQMSDKARKAYIAEKARLKRIKELVESAGYTFDLKGIRELVKDADAFEKILPKLVMTSSNKNKGWAIIAMYTEYHKGAMLSGLSTGVINLASPLAWSTYRNALESPISAILNSTIAMIKGKDVKDVKGLLVRDYWGVTKKMAAGSVKGAIAGLGYGMNSVLNLARTKQRRTIQEDTGFDPLGKGLEDRDWAPKKSIPGVLGALVRVVGYGPIAATDQFMNSIISHTLVYAYAQRIARHEGLKKDSKQYDSRVEELIIDKTSIAWQAAMGEATEQVFQGKGEEGTIRSGIFKAVEGLKNIPALGPVLDNTIFPFHKAMINLPAEGFARMPGFAQIPMMVKIIQNKREGKPTFEDVANSEEVAGQILFTMLALFIASMIDGDEEKTTITGAMLDYNRQERQHRYTEGVAPPTSVKMFDEWWSFDKADPIATPISILTDAISAYKKGKSKTEVLQEIGISSMKQVSGKTFGQGLRDAVRALSEEGGFRKWAVNFTGSNMPNIYQQAARAGLPLGVAPGQDYVGYNPSEGFLEEVGKRTETKATDPIYDVWGRKAKNITGITGIKVASAKLFKGDRVFVNWNQNNEKKAYPADPSNEYTGEMGATRKLDSKQFSNFRRVSGTLAKDLVMEMIPSNHARTPDALTLKLTRSILTRARTEVKNHWKDKGNFDINENALKRRIRSMARANVLKTPDKPRQTGDPTQNLEEELQAWEDMKKAIKRYRSSSGGIRQ